MPDSKAINKVIYGGQILIDLTSDTVVAEKLLAGYKAHGADGKIVTGTCDYDMNTQEANATAAEILSGKKAGVAGSMSGTEGANPQAKTVTPTTSQQEILPDEGYNYLSQVTVLAIPYVESENPQGGMTVTIG